MACEPETTINNQQLSNMENNIDVFNEVVTSDQVKTPSTASDGEQKDTLTGLNQLFGGINVGDYVNGTVLTEVWEYAYNPLTGYGYKVKSKSSLDYAINTSLYPDPEGDPNLKRISDVNHEDVTKAQEELLSPGSQIYPRSGYLSNGMLVTSGVTHLRVLIGGESNIIAMSTSASGVVSLLTEVGATIGVTPVAFESALSFEKKFTNTVDMVASSSLFIGDRCRTEFGLWEKVSDSSGDIYDFKPLTTLYIDDLAPVENADAYSEFFIAHDLANTFGVNVKSKGKNYIIDLTGGLPSIKVQTDFNYGGSVISPISDTSPFDWMEIMPSEGKEEQSLSLAATALCKSTTRGQTHIDNWNNTDPATNSLVFIETDALLADRVGYSQSWNMQDTFFVMADGNIDGRLLSYLGEGTVTEATYKPMEDSQLVGKNFSIFLQNNTTPTPSIKISRHLTRLEGWKVARENLNMDASENVNVNVFRPERVYKFELGTGQSDPIGKGFPGYANFDAGYIVQPFHVVGITMEYITCVGQWGCTAGEFIKNWTIRDCTLNRVDCHFGLCDLTIENSDIYGWGVNVDYGLGTISINNVDYYPQLTRNESGIYALEQRNFIETSGDGYSTNFEGDISVDNLTINIPNVTTYTELAIVSTGRTDSYNFVDTYLPQVTLPRRIELNNVKVKYHYQRPDNIVNVRINGVLIDTRTGVMNVTLPDSITVDNMSFFTLHTGSRIRPVNLTDLSSGLITGDLAININNCKCSGTLNALDNPGGTSGNQSSRLTELQTHALIYHGGSFGGAGWDTYSGGFTVNITDSWGSFYNNNFIGTLKIDNSKVFGLRVEDDTTLASTTNSTIYPHVIAPNATISIGDISLYNNRIMPSFDNGVEPTGSFLYSTIGANLGNIVDAAAAAAFSQAAIDAMWSNKPDGTSWKTPT